MAISGATAPIATPRTPSTNVDTRHPAYNDCVEDWDVVATCVAGERAVKAGGTKWLPNPSDAPEITDEEGTRYARYKARAAFVNATGRTLNGLLGIVFGETLTIELTGNMSVLETDVDGSGVPMTQLVRNMLSQNLQRGRGGVLVDFNGKFTDTKANMGRPLLRFFTAKQIINWRVVNKKTKLVVLRWEEYADLPDDFNQYTVVYWLELRILKDGKAYSRLHMDASASGGLSADAAVTDYQAIMIGNTHATELPFVWMGSTDNDADPDVPPLSDLAWMNIKHYHAEANIAEISHLVGNPTLVLTGLDRKWAEDFFPNGVFIGATEGLQLPRDGDAKIIQAEDRNMPLVLAERRENQLAKLGAKLVERGGGARTATQAQDEAQTDNSILSLCATNVEACLNAALIIAEQYAGGSGKGVVTLPKKYDIAMLDSQAITALLAAVQDGALLLEDFVRYTQRIGVADPKRPASEIMELLRIQPPLTIGGDPNAIIDEPTTTKQLPSPKDKTA